MFTCDGGKTKFVGYLRRFTEEAKKNREAIAKNATGQPSPLMIEVEDVGGIEIKKPKTGDTGWVKESDPASEQIRDVKCPDGQPAELVPGVE